MKSLYPFKLICIMTVGVFLAHCNGKKSSKPTGGFPAPKDANVVCSGDEALDVDSTEGLVDESANLALTAACNLKVEDLDVTTIIKQESPRIAFPQITVRSSLESSRASCKVTSLDSACEESFEIAFRETRDLKCTGKLQISCQACVQESSDSCGCGRTVKSQVFKFDGNDYKAEGDAVEEELPNGINLTSSSTRLRALTCPGASRLRDELKDYAAQIPKMKNIAETTRFRSKVAELYQVIATCFKKETLNLFEDLPSDAKIIKAIEKERETNPKSAQILTALADMLQSAKNMSVREIPVLASVLEVKFADLIDDATKGVQEESSLSLTGSGRKGFHGLHLAESPEDCASDGSSDGGDTGNGDSGFPTSSSTGSVNIDDLIGGSSSSSSSSSGDEFADIKGGDNIFDSPNDDESKVGVENLEEVVDTGKTKEDKEQNTFVLVLGGTAIALGSLGVIYQGSKVVTGKSRGVQETFTFGALGKKTPRNLILETDYFVGAPKEAYSRYEDLGKNRIELQELKKQLDELPEGDPRKAQLLEAHNSKKGILTDGEVTAKNIDQRIKNTEIQMKNHAKTVIESDAFTKRIDASEVASLKTAVNSGDNFDFSKFDAAIKKPKLESATSVRLKSLAKLGLFAGVVALGAAFVHSEVGPQDMSIDKNEAISEADSITLTLTDKDDDDKNRSKSNSRSSGVDLEEVQSRLNLWRTVLSEYGKITLDLNEIKIDGLVRESNLIQVGSQSN